MKKAFPMIAVLVVAVLVVVAASNRPVDSAVEAAIDAPSGDTPSAKEPVKEGNLIVESGDRNLRIESIRTILKSGKGIKEPDLVLRVKDILVFDATIQFDQGMSAQSIMDTMREANVGMALIYDVDRTEPKEHRSIELVKEHPSQFLLAAPKMTQLWRENPDEYSGLLTDALATTSIQAVGEIHLNHNCKNRSDHEPVTVDPTSDAVRSMARLAAERNVPLFIHYEPMKDGSLLKEMEALLSSEPKTKFVWAHAGWESAEVVNGIMERNPNLFFTIAKRVGPGRICDAELQARVKEQRPILSKDGRIKKEWRSVFRDHSRRIMYASDAHVSELLGEDYVQKLNRWRYALARDLYPMDVRRVLHINAIQLFAPDLFKTLKPPKKNFVKGNGSKGLTDKHWKRKKKQDQKKRMKKHKEKQSSR